LTVRGTSRCAPALPRKSARAELAAEDLGWRLPAARDAFEFRRELRTGRVRTAAAARRVPCKGEQERGDSSWRGTLFAHIRLSQIAKGSFRERKRCSSSGHRGRHQLPTHLRAALLFEGLRERVLRNQRVRPDGDEGSAAEADLPVARSHHQQWSAARPVDRGRGRLGDEGLGDREGSDALRSRLLSAHRLHRRKARQLPLARRRWRRDRGVRREDPDPGRARCFELSERRHPRDLRGTRLHRLGRHEPRLHPRESERHDAMHPDGLRLVDGRGARQEDAAPALGPGAQPAGAARARDLRPRGSRDGLLVRRRRAGILPHRPALLLLAARPAGFGPDPLRRTAAQGAGVRGSLLRRDPRARARVHARDRARALQARHPRQDPAQRGGAGSVRGGAGLREREPRDRPSAAPHGHAAEGRGALRHGLPAP
jgi:hypothetical protein